ncbi:MAG: hypothetical protein AAGF67_02435 [Verrucomicrobiota bacterium]
MKSFFFLLLLLLLGSLSLGEEKETGTATDSETSGDVPRELISPPLRTSLDDVSIYRGFDSLEDIKDWAYHTSRFWGGAARLEFSGQEIFYSTRTFTSGTATTEIIFFSRNHRERIFPLLLIPLMYRELHVKVEDSQVVVEAFVDSKLTPVLSFTGDMLRDLGEREAAPSGGEESLGLDRFLSDDLIGYLSVSKEHSLVPIHSIEEERGALRVSRFILSGFSQKVKSVAFTIVEKSDQSWVDVSWLFQDWKEPKVFRTELGKGDLKAWRSALQQLDRKALDLVEDEVGERTLDGRSVYLAVKSESDEYQYGFRNPSYANLPGLQSIRKIDLLLNDWSSNSYGPAEYDYEPNPGTERRK